MNQPQDLETGALLDNLLTSLLDDFDHWFARGEELLSLCPEDVMDGSERQAFQARLAEAIKAVAATRALMRASNQPMAVSMKAMHPWHALVTEVWGLASRIAAQDRGQAPS